MEKIINKIIRKYCKHKKIYITYEPVCEDTHYEYEHCSKCGMTRKSIVSDGIRVEGDWNGKD